MRTYAAFAVLAALSATASAARAEDRYAPPSGFAENTPVSGPLLSWPGKAAPAAPAASPRPIPFAAGQPTLPTSLYDPAPAAATPVPTSAVADATVQPMITGTGGQPPRYYSVHRQYGIQPDPISPSGGQAATQPVGLSTQFLSDGGSADLADPPAPPPHRLSSAQSANMSASAATYQSRAAAEANQAGDAGALN